MISLDFRAWWVYWLGPALGAALGVGIHKITPLKHMEIEVAKLFHFEHDPYQVFKIEKTFPAAASRDDPLHQDAGSHG